MPKPTLDVVGQSDVGGWYHPHKAVDWDGLILDPKTGELVKEQSMTKQSFKEECDINNIVKRIFQNGEIALLTANQQQGLYTDLPDPIDYQGALNVKIAADQAFDSLPAALRARFDNNVEGFLDYMSDPANQEEIIELGLATDTRPPAPPTPAPEPAPAPAPAPAKE